MQPLVDDIRYALRQLRRSPGFALTAVLTLALGIGAVVAVFSVVYAVLLRPYGPEQAGRLVVWRETMQEARQTMPVLPDNYKHYLQLKRQSHTVADAAAVQNTDVSVSPEGAHDHPELLHGLNVSPNLLRVLDVTPALGRAFLPEEAQPGRNHEVILAWPTFERLFHGSPDAIGRTIRLGGSPRVVVGVLPRGFRFPPLSEIPGGVESGSTERYQVLLPLVPTESEQTTDDAEYNFVVVARLHPGVSLAAAQTELDGLEKADARTNHVALHLGVVVTSLAEEVTHSVSTALWLLLAATGGVLLIACVNLANLQLARGVTRERELAMRVALGASRSRLLRLALAESLLLALSGGLLGVIAAYAAVRLAVAAAPASVPRINELGVNWPALAAALALACGTTLLFGLLPALATLHVDPQRSLQAAASSAAGAWKAARLRRVLVATEIALSLVLLTLTGLAARSFRRVLTEDRHFASDHVTLAQVALYAPQYTDNASAGPGAAEPAKRRAAYIDQALDRLRALPGVTAAAITDVVPLTGDTHVDSVARPDHPLPEGKRPMANLRMISPGYFAAMGIPLLAGREFDARERDHPNTVILSEKTARAAWPGENPLGRTLTQMGQTFTVVGISADARVNDLKRDAAMFYLPYWAQSPSQPTFLVRSTEPPAAIAQAVRQTLWSVDGDATLSLLIPLTTQLNSSVADDRFQALLFSCFGAAALLLAALGVYGVLAYMVSLRTREFGVRMALGSPRAALASLVLRDAALPMLCGLAGGCLVTLLAGRLTRSLLYQTAPDDPLAIGSGIAVLILVATLATVLPARRAARTDPVEVLRQN